MHTQAAELRTPMTVKAAHRFASFAALLQMICAAHELARHEESLTPEFTARQAMGFTFTEGNRASFSVPFGHRFVIEQVSLSCWAETVHMYVHLATKAPRHYRTLTLYCPPADAVPGFSCECAGNTPIVVNGSSRSTFLFSNGEGESSTTVPSETLCAGVGLPGAIEARKSLLKRI